MKYLESLETVYVITGIVLAIFAGLTLSDRQHPRRFSSGLFWLILAVIFIAGALLPHWLAGLLVLIMVGLDGAGRVKRSDRAETPAVEQSDNAGRFGDKVFLPVMIIPIVTFAVAILFRAIGKDPNRGALLGLGLGGVVAMAVGLKLTRSSIRSLMEEGRRLNESMGAVNILPQLLASLGVIFAAAKMGDLVAGGINHVIPSGNLFLLVAANCLGMALFAIVMGNSFAAFPVIVSGVLVPLLIKPFGVDPAMAAIITLTAGSSGTLMTPMAANFNIVPAALLNMRDQYGVIKFQLPYAITIWICHVLLMYFMIRLL